MLCMWFGHSSHIAYPSDLGYSMWSMPEWSLFSTRFPSEAPKGLMYHRLIACNEISLSAFCCIQTGTSWQSQSSIWNRPLLSPPGQGQQQQQQQQQQQRRQGQQQQNGLARTSPDWRPSTADCEERFFTQIVREGAIGHSCKKGGGGGDLLP